MTDALALHGERMSMIWEQGDGVPRWRHWGARIEPVPPFCLEEVRGAATLSMDADVPLDLAPTLGAGWFGPAALVAHRDGRQLVHSWAAVESVASDGTRYVAARELAGVPGAIKAFRDPAFFNDPATGHDHLFFTGSAGWDNDAHNGLVGRATRIDGRWRLDDPVVEAVGVNNELERPHVRRFDGRYYLFFSTQRRTFADPASAGPNGLYALSASRLGGPWSPVNGSGLVAANPPAEPTQAYSWWVEGDGRVASFIDHWGRAGRSFASHPGLLRSQFGGTPAPEFRLDFAADRVTIRR